MLISAVIYCLLVSGAASSCLRSDKALSGDNLTEIIDCDGLCWQCRLSAFTNSKKENILEWSSQDCGVGSIPITAALPGPVSSSFGSDVQLTDVCELFGLGDVLTEMTCITNIDEIIERAPAIIKGVVESLKAFVVSVSICCCPGDLCNDFTPPYQCYDSSKSSLSLEEPGIVPCDGPCFSCQIATNDEEYGEREWISQSCGRSLFRLLDVTPPQVVRFDIPTNLTFENYCALASLEPTDPTPVCHSGPDLVRGFVPREIPQDETERFYEIIVDVKICCCLGSLCNEPLLPLLNE